MGVIDVLPSCVSSVYFMYEKKWERFSLGKVRRAFPFFGAGKSHPAPFVFCI